MTPRWTSPLTGSVVYEADARKVAATLPEGIASCAVLDGPYSAGKGAWDRIPRGGTLGDLYTGHLDDVGRVCAKSASLYVWNTSRGLMDLDPLILARGWVFAGMIIWHKLGAHPALIAPGKTRRWPDITEACGHYQRGEAYHVNDGTPNVWSLDSTNEMRRGERLFSEERKTRSTTGYQDRVPLHPCQKPLLFAERMIRASTRPGDTVWVPFGGTLRELVAAERMARGKPEEARRVITCELNQDGVDYIGPAIAQAQGLETKTGAQVGLFGGAA